MSSSSPSSIASLWSSGERLPASSELPLRESGANFGFLSFEREREGEDSIREVIEVAGREAVVGGRCSEDLGDTDGEGDEEAGEEEEEKWTLVGLVRMS